MSKGGRTKDPIRDYVTVCADSKNHVNCNYCDHRMYNQVRTMRSHLLDCNEVTAEHKILIKGMCDKTKQQQSARIANKTKAASADHTILGKRLRAEFLEDDELKEAEQPRMIPSVLKQGDIRDYKSNYYYKMNKQQQQMGIRLLANMVVRTPMSINIVENEYFIRYSNHLNASFNIPSRPTFTDKHLIEFHELIVEETESCLKELRSVSLGLDGSSDGNGNPIEHIIAGRGEYGFFLDEVAMHGVDKTAERLVDLLKAAKSKLTALGVKVLGMNRDNESKMQKAGRLFCEEEGVDDIGCAPHVLHLIVGGFFADNVRAKFAKDCGQKVLVHYKNSKSKHHLIAVKRLPPSAKFGIPIGEDGRWGSYHKSMLWLQEHKQDMKQQCITDDYNKSLTVEVKNIILNEDEFWDDLDFTVATVKPIDATLRIFERDNMNPGEVLFRYKSLKEEYQNLERLSVISRDQYRYFCRKLDEKWTLMSSPLHYGVYLIDPRFRDHPLPFDELKIGEECLKDKAGDDWGLWEKFYLQYHEPAAPFNDASFNIGINDDPRKCYKPLTRAQGYKEYGLFCVDLLNINGTSVKLERSFKSVRFIHSKLRRCLREDTLKRLVYDHANLNAIEKYRGKPFL